MSTLLHATVTAGGSRQSTFAPMDKATKCSQAAYREDPELYFRPRLPLTPVSRRFRLLQFNATRW